LSSTQRHNPCYTNVVTPDNHTEVLLPLQLLFCHSQPAGKNFCDLAKGIHLPKTPAITSLRLFRSIFNLDMFAEE
jgi:hypothetical protein